MDEAARAKLEGDARGLCQREVVALLNEMFSTFDAVALRHGLEKIKTIGDAYMVVGGLPDLRTDHASDGPRDPRRDGPPGRRPRVADRGAHRACHRRRHRHDQVQLRPLGRHREHGESYGISRRGGRDPRERRLPRRAGRPFRGRRARRRRHQAHAFVGLAVLDCMHELAPDVQISISPMDPDGSTRVVYARGPL